MKLSIKKLSVAILLIFTLLVSQAYADTSNIDEVKEITVENAIEMGLEYTHTKAEIEQSIDNLWDAYINQVQMWNLMKGQLDSFDEYYSLYTRDLDGIELEPMDQVRLEMYRAIYGPKPPQIAPVDKFNNYIKVGQFPCMQLYNAVEDLRLQKRLFETSFTSSIQDIFSSILELKNELKIQNEFFGVMHKQNEQMHEKYKNGFISEFDLYSSDIALSQQELAIDILERNIENLAMTLKSQIGIPLDQKVEFVASSNYLSVKLYSSYKYYIEKALSSRQEVLSAGADLQVKNNELDVVKKYFDHEKLTERIDAQIAADEATIAYDDAVNKVTIDIKNGYLDVISKYNEMVLLNSNKLSAKRQLDQAEILYDKGMITYIDFLNYEIAYNKARIDYESSVYRYNRSVQKLMTASGIGPGYFSQGGIR